MKILFIALLFTAGLFSGCVSHPSSSLLEQYGSSQSSHLSYVGSYKNTPCNSDKDTPSFKSGGDSLYNTLTQNFETIFTITEGMYPKVSEEAITVISHISGNKFNVSLMDYGELVESHIIKLSFQDGYLHSKHKWRVLPLIFVNGFNNEVYSLVLDSQGNLMAFESFYGASGYFIFLQGNLFRYYGRFPRVSQTTLSTNTIERYVSSGSFVNDSLSNTQIMFRVEDCVIDTNHTSYIANAPLL